MPSESISIAIQCMCQVYQNTFAIVIADIDLNFQISDKFWV